MFLCSFIEKDKQHFAKKCESKIFVYFVLRKWINVIVNNKLFGNDDAMEAISRNLEALRPPKMPRQCFQLRKECSASSPAAATKRKPIAAACDAQDKAAQSPCYPWSHWAQPAVFVLWAAGVGLYPAPD